MTDTRYKIFTDDQYVPYFLTCTVINWLPYLNSRWTANIVIDSLRFLQIKERLTLYAYVIMENHLHLIASAINLTSEIGSFKSFTARQIIDGYQSRGASHVLEQLAWYKSRPREKNRYQFWQLGSKPKRISNQAMMEQKIAYIHNNPVKRGWVDDPVHWCYSSARNYAGLAGALEVETGW